MVGGGTAEEPSDVRRGGAIRDRGGLQRKAEPEIAGKLCVGLAVYIGKQPYSFRTADSIVWHRINTMLWV